MKLLSESKENGLSRLHTTILRMAAKSDVIGTS